MISKVIHYCWFGGKPLPKLAEKCIESWKRYLPDYEIKRWDETNFDVNSISYTKEAYECGKYAFVSDYARFWILYNYGGIYFDTDVEVIKPIDDIVAAGPFMGVEQQNESFISVAPGLCLATEQHDGVLLEFLELYQSSHFKNEDGSLCLKNVVEITTEYLLTKGLQNIQSVQQCCGFNIYPKDYFCPIDYATRILNITTNTRAIHHYAESWLPKSTRLKNYIGRKLGGGFLNKLVSLKQILRSIIK